MGMKLGQFLPNTQNSLDEKHKHYEESAACMKKILEDDDGVKQKKRQKRGFFNRMLNRIKG